LQKTGVGEAHENSPFSLAKFAVGEFLQEGLSWFDFYNSMEMEMPL
jgi:hypothetical protein